MRMKINEFKKEYELGLNEWITMEEMVERGKRNYKN